MKKVLNVLSIVLLGLLLVGCMDKKPSTPIEETPIEETPVEETPIEDEVEDKEDEIEDEFKLYGSDFEQGEFQTATINTSNMTEITITIIAESIYDVPVNFDNWKVDNELVTYEGLTDNKYQVNKDITIGGLPTVVTLVNLHQNQIRLHTVPSSSTPEGHDGKHFIKINVADIDSFSFDFGITTGAFAYIQNIKVDFTYSK